MLKKIQLNICPNPSCQKTFENLIIIHDESKMPAEIFYGCPYCFFKLDPTATNVLKKMEKVIEVKISCNSSSKKETIPNCPHYFGYLFEHFSDSIIPKQCLECEKMSSCIIHCSNETNRTIKESV
jgi:hypothetical protein